MKINLMCEWCGKVMKTVTTFEKVRDAQQKGEEICPTCVKKVEKMDTYFAGARQKYDARIDGLIREMKDDFKATLQKGDFGDGEDIQDVGSEDKASRGSSK
jgi:uncharacterized Zn finger protein (UPF0148 family)